MEEAAVARRENRPTDAHPDLGNAVALIRVMGEQLFWIWRMRFDHWQFFERMRGRLKRRSGCGRRRGTCTPRSMSRRVWPNARAGWRVSDEVNFDRPMMITG